MKKTLILTSFIGLIVFGANATTIEEHDADFTGCERVDTTEEHLVYKCPSDVEWVQNIKNSGVEPNAMFQTGGELNFDVVNSDTEHTYVEVVRGKYGKGYCEEDFHYRTMVKPINFETDEYYAVVGCK